MDSDTRTLVLMRQDVAPNNWHRPFSELVAEAEAACDGFRLLEQGKTGKQERYWDLEVPIPKGWAAFYRGSGRHEATAFLHIQKY